MECRDTTPNLYELIKLTGTPLYFPRRIKNNMKTITLKPCSFSVPATTHCVLLEAGREYPLTGTFVLFPDDSHGVYINVENHTTLDQNGNPTEGTLRVYDACGVSVSGKKEYVMVGVPHTSGKISVIYTSEIK